ncbi:MAG: hypothetical protein IT239_00405 [Bacteroidia bacterium]|nr:hypothetical protein [Bacteroidia bacterium]
MKKRKKLTFSVIAVSIVFAAFSFINADECDESAFLKKIYSAWGERCAKCGDLSDKSYSIRYRNEATFPLDIRIALQKNNNRGWQVFTFKGVAPRDSFQVCVCDGTSKVMKWVIKSGDASCVLPTEAEINKLVTQ